MRVTAIWFRPMDVPAQGESLGRGPVAGLAVCWEPANLRRTIAIALVVGTILTLVNQVEVLLDGRATWVTGVKVAANYLVPFIVSNLGVLTAARNRPA